MWIDISHTYGTETSYKAFTKQQIMCKHNILCIIRQYWSNLLQINVMNNYSHEL